MLVGWSQGSAVEKFVFWPNNDLGRFAGGYVNLDPPLPESVWLMSAAPFLSDALLVAVGFGLARWFWRSERRWLWLGTTLLLIVGPLANSVWGSLFRYGDYNSDVEKLLRQLPDWIVHGWFLMTVPIYAAALLWTLRDSPTAAT